MERHQGEAAEAQPGALHHLHYSLEEHNSDPAETKQPQQNKRNSNGRKTGALRHATDPVKDK